MLRVQDTQEMERRAHDGALDRLHLRPEWVKTTRVPSIRSKTSSRDLRVTPVTPVAVGEKMMNDDRG